MSQGELGFEKSLATNVLATGRCVGCGACILVCPFGCLEYSEERPCLVKECKTCGSCSQACPEYGWSRAEGERFVFGRESRAVEAFGIYRRLALAQVTDNNVLGVAQNGGVVTGLLRFALENRIIDGAIVSGIDTEKPFRPVPKLVTTPEDVLRCAGTRYSYSPGLSALRGATERGLSKVAFVGTPCQIRAIRKMQMAEMGKYVDRVGFLIGLLCSECFDYAGFMRGICKALKIRPEGIRKIDIKGKIQIATSHGTRSLSLDDVRKHSRPGCRSCIDFSSELADLSMGGLGLDKWTLVIVRTQKGEELFSKAENAGILRTGEAEKETLWLLAHLSVKKKSRSG